MWMGRCDAGELSQPELGDTRESGGSLREIGTGGRRQKLVDGAEWCGELKRAGGGRSAWTGPLAAGDWNTPERHIFMVRNSKNRIS